MLTTVAVTTIVQFTRPYFVQGTSGLIHPGPLEPYTESDVAAVDYEQWTMAQNMSEVGADLPDLGVFLTIHTRFEFDPPLCPSDRSL